MAVAELDALAANIEDRQKPHIDELHRTFLRTINALSRIMEIRDLYTLGHQQKVSQIARSIGRELGLSGNVIEGMRVGATLHDIGKLGVPAEIRAKPATLTPVEFELVKTHSAPGHSILKEINFPWPVAEMVHQHHERLDGSGYPQGLKGDDILIEAQIVGLADALDSIASHRPYRPSRGADQAMEIIGQGAGSLFNPQAVEACRQLLKRGEISLDK